MRVFVTRPRCRCRQGFHLGAFRLSGLTTSLLSVTLVILHPTQTTAHTLCLRLLRVFVARPRCRCRLLCVFVARSRCRCRQEFHLDAFRLGGLTTSLLSATLVLFCVSLSLGSDADADFCGSSLVGPDADADRDFTWVPLDWWLLATSLLSATLLPSSRCEMRRARMSRRSTHRFRPTEELFVNLNKKIAALFDTHDNNYCHN